MAYRDRIQTYQRIRTVILKDAWLIDHDHREDEREDGVEEEASDAACLTGRAGSLQTAVGRSVNPTAGPISPTTRTVAVAAVMSMPHWARR